MIYSTRITFYTYDTWNNLKELFLSKLIKYQQTHKLAFYEEIGDEN